MEQVKTGIPLHCHKAKAPFQVITTSTETC